MKTRLKLTALIGAAVFAAYSQTASAVPVETTTFGDIPGAPADPYSGHGIPTADSVVSVTTGLPGPSFQSGPDTLTLALSTTAHGSGNPAPGNDGVSTFFVDTGLNGGASKWNFDFYGDSKLGLLGHYNFTLTVSDGYGHTVSIDPTLISDNADGPNGFGNSWRLEFFGASFPYNPDLDDTYYVDLSATYGDGLVAGDVKETIVAGDGHNVPDGGSTAGLLAASLGGLIFVGNKKKFFSKLTMAAAS